MQEFKLIKLNDGAGSRRSRKTINYMKLNEGILCENERPEVEDTCQDSEANPRKTDLMREEEDISLEEKLFGSRKLADIMEVEEKEHEREHLDQVEDLEHPG